MFGSLADLFDAATKLDYVVLRNYEEFDNMDFLLNHPDIDILCRDPQQMADVLSLQPRRKREDGIHYYAMIAEKKVAVDLRHVGDGYLDAKWEENILKSRKSRKNFYVMDTHNYFYSLLYHVVVQKYVVAEDYVKRLCDMAEELSIVFEQEQKENILDTFMRENGYRYTYPEYSGTIFQIDGVDKSLVEQNAGKWIKRMVYGVMKKMWSMVKK